MKNNILVSVFLFFCFANFVFAQQDEQIYECKQTQERIYMSYKISAYIWYFETKNSLRTPLLIRYDKINPNSDSDTIFVYFEKKPEYDFAFREIRQQKADMFPQKLIRINPDNSQSVFELVADASVQWHQLKNQGKSNTEIIHYGFDLSNGKKYYAYESTSSKRKELILVKEENDYISLKFKDAKQIYKFQYPNQTALQAYPVPPFLIRINPDGSKSKFFLDKK